MMYKIAESIDKNKGLFVMVIMAACFYYYKVVPSGETMMASDTDRMILKFGFSVFGLYFLARFFDWMNGVEFRNVIEKINNDPVSAAFYNGFRLIAIAIVLCGI